MTRERVLAAAADLFSQKGYSATKTREIAQRLDLKRASLYHHIDSKEDLLYELSMSALTSIQRSMDSKLASARTSAEKVSILIVAHIAEVLKRQPQAVILLLENRSLPAKRSQDLVRLRDRYDRLVEETLENAQRDGFLRADVPARVLALALLNLTNWTVVWYQPSGTYSPEEIGHYFASLFIEGARASDLHA